MKKIVELIILMIITVILSFSSTSTILANDKIFNLDKSKINETGTITIHFKDIKPHYFIGIVGDNPHYNNYIRIYLDENKNTAVISMPNKSGNFTLNIFESVYNLKSKTTTNEFLESYNLEYNFDAVDKEKYYTSSTEVLNFDRAKNVINYYENFKVDTKEDIDKLLSDLLTHFKYNNFRSLDNKQYYERDILLNIDEIFNSGSGVCIDFSSVLATVLRSKAIKCTMAFGYTNRINSYHAWNEFYFDDKLYIYDLTIAASYKNLDIGYGEKKDYTVKKYYQ